MFRDRRRKQRILVEKLSGTFSRWSGTFLPFFARPRAIALGSKPPLVTRIARTGLGMRLLYHVYGGAFHSTQHSGNFGCHIKWNGPFRFGPTGIRDQLWRWSTVTGLVISVGRTEMSLSICQNCCPQYRSFLSCLQDQVVSNGKWSAVSKAWHLK